MTPATTRHGTLARVGSLAYRRRGRMVVGWIGLLAAVLALSPLLAGDVAAEFIASSA